MSNDAGKLVGTSGTMALPGETESGSAGTQPDKGYPGRRCAKGASGPWWEDPSGAVFFPYPWTPSSCLRKSCGEAASVATTAAAVHDWTFYQAAVELCQRANLPIPWITRRGTHLEQGRATGS